MLQLTGRTTCDRIVVFDGNRRLIGQLLPIVIYDTTAVHAVRQRRDQHVGPEVYT